MHFGGSEALENRLRALSGLDETHSRISPCCHHLARQHAGRAAKIVDEIDGRLIRVGNQWLIDFASSNYLGFDLEPQIIDAITAYLARWGTHPGWSRLRRWITRR